MKKLGYIFLVFVLILIFNLPAISQSSKSTAQTVMFSVDRSVKSALKILESSQSISGAIHSTEMITLQNELNRQSAKITISAPNKNIKNDNEVKLEEGSGSVLTTSAAVTQPCIIPEVHLDLRAVNSINSPTVEKSPLVLTITD